MVAFLIALHVFVSISLILIVLLQPGNKQGMGAAMGGGGAQTVFGGRGANTFLSKLTVGLATVFMLNSVVLVYVSSDTGSVTDGIVDDTKADKNDVKGDTEVSTDEAVAPTDQPVAPEADSPDEGQAAGDEAAVPATDTAAEAEGTAADEVVAPAAAGGEAKEGGEKPKTDTPVTP